MQATSLVRTDGCRPVRNARHKNTPVAWCLVSVRAGRFILTFTADLAMDQEVNSKARRLTALSTTPLRRHRVQTRTDLVEPSSVTTFTLCKLGLNFRRVIPVILVPTPPRYLGLPRVFTEFPIWVRFPQYWQTRAITIPLFFSNGLNCRHVV